MPEEKTATTVKPGGFFSDFDLTLLFPPLLAWKLTKRLFARLFGGWIVNNILLPARSRPFQGYPQGLYPPSFTVEAADGAKLDTIEFLPPTFSSKKRKLYLIHFLGNEGRYEELRAQLAKQAAELGVTVIAFNYQGVQRSTGPVHSIEDLINGGIAQVERLLKMGIDPEDITLCGHSLGGMVANGVGAVLHKNKKRVNVFNDRSMSSLADVGTGLAAAFFSKNPPLDLITAEEDSKRDGALPQKNAFVLQRNAQGSQCKLIFADQEGAQKPLETFDIRGCDVVVSAPYTERIHTGRPCYIFQKAATRNGWNMGFCDARGRSLLSANGKTGEIVDYFDEKKPDDGLGSQLIARKLAEWEKASLEDKPAIMQTVQHALIDRRQYYKHDVLYAHPMPKLACLVEKLYSTDEAEEKQKMRSAIQSELQFKSRFNGYWSTTKGKIISRFFARFFESVLATIGWGRNSAQDFLSMPETHTEYMLIRSPKEKRMTNLPVDDSIIQHTDASLHTALKQRRLKSKAEKAKNTARKFQTDHFHDTLHGHFYPDQLKNREGQTPTQFLGSFLDQIGERNKVKKQEAEEKKRELSDRQSKFPRPGPHKKPEG